MTIATLKRGANFLLRDLPDGIERISMQLIAEDGGLSQAVLYKKFGSQPKTAIHIMHPKRDQTLNYNIIPLVQAGYAVMGRAGRWANNDIGTIHEVVLLDMAAGVKELRRQGCDNVILLGNSGGGPLAAFYQSQARKPVGQRLTDTPAGDPFDLNAYDLPPADGIVLIGAHMGEGFVLGKWLDPSLVDYHDKLSVDPELDMYNFDNGFRIPPEPSSYSKDFLVRFAAGQERRAHWMDRLARSRIQRKREAEAEVNRLAGRDELDRSLQWQERRAAQMSHMLIFRAQACPEWLDPSIAPDDRDICTFHNHPRPDIANYEPFLAPILTPEAYLSTWSPISSRARTPDCLAEVEDPLFIVHYNGDSTTNPIEANDAIERSASRIKDLITVRGLDHYGFRITGPHQRGERELTGTNAVVDWLRQRFPV